MHRIMKYFVEQRACANKYNPKEEERGAIKDVGTSKFWGSGKKEKAALSVSHHRDNP